MHAPLSRVGFRPGTVSARRPVRKESPPRPRSPRNPGKCPVETGLIFRVSWGISPPDRLRSQARSSSSVRRLDTISWPCPAFCVAAASTRCTTATRPSAAGNSSDERCGGAWRPEVAARSQARLPAARMQVWGSSRAGGAHSSPLCTEAGVGELSRATAAVSSPAAPCCWQLVLAPHAQFSGLSALTAGGTSLPTSAACAVAGSRLGCGPARCGGRRGDVFGI